MKFGSHNFRHVVLYDLEFATPQGELQVPVCLVAHDLVTGQTIRIWEDDLRGLKAPPFPFGDDTLTVSYYAIAELGCHIALHWPLPEYILDLCVEFKCLTNCLRPKGFGGTLLDALNWYGLDGLSVVEKESMRELAQRGGPWTEEEKKSLLDYCETDVVALKKLLPKMLPQLDVERALYRGHCQKAMAIVQSRGAPLDVVSLNKLQKHWDTIQDKLIARIDANYQVYDGRTFKSDRFAKFLEGNNIPWPLTPTGKLQLDKDTFKDMSRSYPQLTSLQELRSTLGQMRLNSIVAGDDGRNRCSLWPFSGKTGRNQPSTAEFIFGLSAWIRKLIQAAPGRAIGYIDYEQQEFGIAAALSKDPKMMDAYISGDAYLAFARQAGAFKGEYIPKIHKAIRGQFKQCSLGTQYGMGEFTLGQRINQPTCRARQLLRLHRETYPKFWDWSDTVVDYAMLNGHLYTVFGWLIHINEGSKSTSLRNFPMQANGAEILRLAVNRIVARGINICATVHDAILIDEPIENIEGAVSIAQQEMAEASRIILDGFELRTEAKIFRHPERYHDERGEEIWTTVWDLIKEAEAQEPAQNCTTDSSAHALLPAQNHSPAPYGSKYGSQESEE